MNATYRSDNLKDMMIKPLPEPIAEILKAMNSGRNWAEIDGIETDTIEFLRGNKLICKNSWTLTLIGKKALGSGFYSSIASNKNSGILDGIARKARKATRKILKTFEESQPGHGGARKGAGRKTEKIGKAPLKKITLMLDDSTIRQFNRAGEGNVSLGARRIAKNTKESGNEMKILNQPKEKQ